MAHELVQINVRNPLLKVVLILLLVVAGVWSYFVVRWYLGNTLAEYFNPAESNFDAAGLALSLAPNDPLTHWRAAEVLQKKSPLDQQGPAIAQYQKAVALSPNDYRYWMTLGTAYERAGEVGKGEEALKHAITRRIARLTRLGIAGERTSDKWIVLIHGLSFALSTEGCHHPCLSESLDCGWRADGQR